MKWSKMCSFQPVIVKFLYSGVKKLYTFYKG